MYQTYKDMIVRVADNAWIPKDSANSDYQKYLSVGC